MGSFCLSIEPTRSIDECQRRSSRIPRFCHLGLGKTDAEVVPAGIAFSAYVHIHVALQGKETSGELLRASSMTLVPIAAAAILVTRGQFID